MPTFLQIPAAICLVSIVWFLIFIYSLRAVQLFQLKRDPAQAIRLQIANKITDADAAESINRLG